MEERDKEQCDQKPVQPGRLKSLFKKARNGSNYLNIGIQKIAIQLLLMDIQKPMRFKEITELVAKRLREKNPGFLFENKTVQKRLYDAALVLKYTNMVEIQRKSIMIRPEKIKELPTYIKKLQEISKKEKKIQQKRQIIRKLKRAKECLGLLMIRNSIFPNSESKQRICIRNLAAILMNKSSLPYTLMVSESEQKQNQVKYQNKYKCECKCFCQCQCSNENNLEVQEQECRWTAKKEEEFKAGEQHVFSDFKQIISNLELVGCLFKSVKKIEL